MAPRRTRRYLAYALVLALATGARAATFVVDDNDGPGEGFNDPTPRSPIGGNSGTTLGAQRLEAFQGAADVWGGTLSSPLTIHVAATMDPLACDATSATLGQAGPTSVASDFTGAARANTWYPLALANEMHGANLAPGTDDITAQFNSAIGTTCSFPIVWYYGLDGDAPPNTIDFFTIVLHELGHGLGFETFVDDATGREFMGRPDAFERNLEDGGVAWPFMTDGQRQASAIDTGHLLWTGPAVVAHSGILLAGRAGNGGVRMFAPNPDQPGSSVSHWDTTCTPDQLMEPVYTVPIHDPSLARDALTDIGWGSGGDGATTTTVTTTTSTTTIPLVCPSSPPAGCRAETASSLKIVDGPPDARDSIAWSWKGGGTAVADFRDPPATGALRFCLYDASGRAQPLIAPEVLPGGWCGRHACWKVRGGGNAYAYRNKRATPDGFVAVRLKATASGQGRITLRGKGANLPVSPLPLVSPVTVDLFVGDGRDNACWQATFTAAKRSDVRFFKAKTP